MNWKQLFPYGNPYSAQEDAIQRAIATLKQSGYFATEGACGTGKTLIALCAANSLTQNPETPFRRTFVVTSVKQQMAQFVEELRSMNKTFDGVDTKATGAVLVGKSEMHPYLREETLENLEGSDSLADLRERTAEIVMHGSDVPLDLRGDDQLTTDQNTWFDPKRAQRAFQNALKLTDIEYTTEEGEDYDAPQLETEGIESPFPLTPPRTEEIIDGDGEIPEEAQGYIDPFYLGFLAQGGEPNFWFSAGEQHILEASDIRREAISRGICPYESMAYFGQVADVVVGNFYHAFHPSTRLLTDEKMGILDEGTLLVVDEAPQLGRKSEVDVLFGLRKSLA